MPVAPPRPCTAPRCNKMITKGSRCEDHQPIAWVSSIGKTPTERGYGSKWVRLRNAAMKRDKYICQLCLLQGICTPAREVDHILNKARGGSDTMDNLQSVCKPCHKAKTQKERLE